PCRTARRSPTASSRRSRAIRTPSARRGASARGTGCRCWCRATAWSPRAGSARTARWASTTSAGCSSSRVQLSLAEDLRNELAAIAPARRCDRLAELSALFHTAGSFHLHGRAEVAVHLDVGSSAVARRAFRLLRELGATAELRTYRQRAFATPTRYQLFV